MPPVASHFHAEAARYTALEPGTASARSCDGDRPHSKTNAEKSKRYTMRCSNTTIIATVLALSTVLTYPPQALAQEGTRSRTGEADQNQARGDMIQNRVYSRLSSSGSLSGSDIKVTLNGNTVVLDGTVADDQAKQRATRIAQRVSGVDAVTNNLRVDKAAVDKNRNVQVSDDQLSKQIAEKLAKQHFPSARVERDWAFGWEVEGDGWEFEVDVDGGDVTLSGDVPRIGVIGEVLRTARSVPGVRTVTSELQADTYYRPYGMWPYWGFHPYPIY